MLRLSDDAQTDKTWKMTGGLPISWDAAWGQLAWRHPRAHKPHGAGRVHATESSRTDPSSTREPGTFQESREVPLAVDNGVTGRNNPKKDRVKGTQEVSRRNAVRELPEHLGSVTAGMLVIIVVDKESAEGELAIGLARAMQSCDGDKECRFLWFVRNEWCTKERKHLWSKSPTFRVAANPENPKKPYITKEPLAKVCPVEVTLTEKSKRDSPRLHLEYMLNAC